jgi:hypothetical protein
VEAKYDALGNTIAPVEEEKKEVQYLYTYIPIKPSFSMLYAVCHYYVFNPLSLYLYRSLGETESR